MTTTRRPETLDDIEVMIREVAASPSTDLSYLRFLLNQYDRILTRLRVSFPGSNEDKSSIDQFRSALLSYRSEVCGKS